MPQSVTVDILDQMRPNLASLIAEKARKLPEMGYCDLRIEVDTPLSGIHCCGVPFIDA